MDVEPGRYLSPQISPDGEFVSVTIRDDNGDSDIWIYDLRRGMLNRLTNSGAASGGIWTRDGSQIVYGSSENEWGTWIVDANGAGQPELLIGSDDMMRVDSFSPDGQELIYRVGAGESDLYVSSSDASGARRQLQISPAAALFAQVSPDGRHITYQSFESGRFEIYVRPFPNVDEGKWQISSGGGLEPRWGPEGRELYYRRVSTLGVELVAVPIAKDPEFSPGIESVLFTGDYFTGSNFFDSSSTYDVSADGQRFLLNKRIRVLDEDPEPEAMRLVLVENWFTELKRLAPPNP